MPNKLEWSLGWFGTVRRENGGSTYGDGYDGGLVGHSRFGEFACRIGDQGEITATFPDVGVMCGYNDEEKLMFVCVDVACFLGNLEKPELAEMANGGENIVSISKDLKARGQTLLMTVFPTMARLVVETRDTMGLVSEDVVVNVDLGEGFAGLIRYEGSQIAYHTMGLGDEMTVSLGEQDAVKRTMVSASVSNEVNYMLELESSSPKKYWNLADKIILNQ